MGPKGSVPERGAGPSAAEAPGREDPQRPADGGVDQEREPATATPSQGSMSCRASRQRDAEAQLFPGSSTRAAEAMPGSRQGTLDSCEKE